MGNSYMDRALRHPDRRYAQILQGLGYRTRHLVARAKPQEPVQPVSVMAELRAEYFALIGKRPFTGWDAETLLRKMDEFRAAASASASEGCE
jgi:hypothetical protein